MSSNAETFLLRAIELARTARENGEDPFGAVLVFNDEIGDLLVEEGLKVFEGYKFIRKAERHRNFNQ